MGDKGTNTTTQNTAPNPAAMAAYRSLMDRASGVANTPYQAYSGNLTAGVNAQQNLGIGNINTASQAGSPWFDYAASMAHPISQSDIERYQNPYTQHVVDATQAQFDRSNAQQQEGLKGREIAQGALGGSRARISAADMGYQQQLGQAPVIAGLYNQSYNQALTAAQQQQQAGFQGAGVGANIQQAGLQGAGAQIGAGTLQQQAEQAALNAQYGQYQQAQAFPYQQAQWLAGIDTGVGSQMGGTSTTTAPAPSLLGQVAGAGVAGVGMAAGLGWKPFAARGGRIEDYDAGGSVGAEPYGGVGFIPHMQIAHGHGAPSAPAPAQIPKPNFDPSKFAFPRPAAGVGAPIDLNAYGNDGGVVGDILPPAPQSGLGPIYYRGGGVRGYQAGGAPAGVDDESEYAMPPPAYTAGPDTGEPVAGVGASDAAPWWGESVAALHGGPSPYFHPQTSFPTLSSRPSPDAGAAFMRARAPAGVAPPPAYDDMAYDDSRSPSAGVGAPPPSRSGGFDWSSLSMPLMAAGLGMMASRSPHPGVAIGEGGLAGVQAYAEQKRQTAEQGLAEKKQALDARRLDQMARQSREHLALQTRTQNFHEKQADRPYTEMTAHEKAALELSKVPNGMRKDESGNLQFIPGGPHDPEVLTREARAKLAPSMLGEAELKGAGEQFFQTGKFPVGMGRSPSERNAIMGKAYEIAAEKNVSPEELPKRWQKFATEQVGTQRFFSGPDGQKVQSLNVAVDHLSTLKELGDALKNGNYPLINGIYNRIAEATGSATPTNFNAASQIVGTEVLKAIGLAGAGSVEDRAKIAKAFSSAQSPQQLEGLINDVVQPLLGGQLRGYRQRFEPATGLPGDRFDQMLMPSTRKFLEGAGHGAAPAGGTAVSAPKRVKQNGHTYEQQPDGSYKPVD